jgi:CMP-N,N'-diacetyllegionaminic acid synthase
MTGTCVALVTGRGGSKRLPGKNVRQLTGRPLIAWTILAACNAATVDRVIVSTDDQAIANAAREAGGEVPFMRPKHLSSDSSSHVGVIMHAVNWLEGTMGILPELLCLLQPTSPMRTSADIDAVVDLVRLTGADCGISVSPAKNHPAYLYRLDKNGQATSYLPPIAGYQRSQDVEPLHAINGAVYVIRPHTFRKREKVLSDDLVAHIMPAERSIDIDTEEDLKFAQWLMQEKPSI